MGRHGNDRMVVGVTHIVSSNPAQARCTRYNIMQYSLSVTCDRSVVFSGYSNKTDRHDITEILLKPKTNQATPLFSDMSRIKRGDQFKV